TELSARINLRLGDGLAPLEEHEADAIALCGMGGMLMAEILSAAPVPLMGAKKVVLQPMRGVSAIRAYLYAQGYRVEEDCVVEDAGRLYQVFSATIGKEDPPPAYWPNGCMRVGFKAADDPLFLRLVQSKRRQYEARLLEANGTRGEDILNEKAAQMRQIEEAIQCGWKYS
ncbi:class I SAM-dependent methyltransferase, partial [Christensenellaceae bacterium OttesenSCG-928-L17]|nr:class I SAM-dependent methyltransferase [Christensenellaceae bacterium OttesenSCG-928-L17]